MNSTRPAPAHSFESLAFIPPSARLSKLALAALQNGVSNDDVSAYLSGRYSVSVGLVELCQ